MVSGSEIVIGTDVMTGICPPSSLLPVGLLSDPDDDDSTEAWSDRGDVDSLGPLVLAESEISGWSGSVTPALMLTLTEGLGTGMMGLESSEVAAAEGDAPLDACSSPVVPLEPALVAVSVSPASLVVVVCSGRGFGTGMMGLEPSEVAAAEGDAPLDVCSSPVGPVEPPRVAASVAPDLLVVVVCSGRGFGTGMMGLEPSEVAAAEGDAPLDACSSPVGPVEPPRVAESVSPALLVVVVWSERGIGNEIPSVNRGLGLGLELPSPDGCPACKPLLEDDEPDCVPSFSVDVWPAVKDVADVVVTGGCGSSGAWDDESGFGGGRPCWLLGPDSDVVLLDPGAFEVCASDGVRDVELSSVAVESVVLRVPVASGLAPLELVSPSWRDDVVLSAVDESPGGLDDVGDREEDCSWELVSDVVDGPVEGLLDSEDDDGAGSGVDSEEGEEEGDGIDVVVSGVSSVVVSVRDDDDVVVLDEDVLLDVVLGSSCGAAPSLGSFVSGMVALGRTARLMCRGK